MGEAKRKRQSGERVSWCRDCTLCCVLPDIVALDKPMYRACRHVDGGCSLFGKPERPSACVAYQCSYLSARLTNAHDRHAIPHPSEAGAYFHRDPVDPLYVLFVDPDRAEHWKGTNVASYLADRLKEGFRLLIIDRGRRMTIGSPHLFDEVLKRDFVAYADQAGRPRDIASFEEFVPRHAEN